MSMTTTQHRLAFTLFKIGIVAHMLENERVVRMDSHDAFAGGAIMLIHVKDGLEKNLEIVLSELHFLREVGADESLADIKSIRDETLSAHGPQRVFRLLALPFCKIGRADIRALDGVVCNGYACDRN